MISSNLPERGSAHTIVEDHVDPDLLFVGTEFGLFFTQDGGESWHRLKSGLPTISVRDIEIQRRENDLVVGTFGRGIYILDDYSPLRTKQGDVGSQHLFEVRDAWSYVVGDVLGYGEKGFFGADYYSAPNPPFGAVFTYRLEEGIETAKKSRRKAEIDIEKEGGDTPYPDWDVVRAEDREEDPAVLLIVRDSDGNVVRQVKGNASAGLHRTAWDLRWPATNPVSLSSPANRAPWSSDPQGPLAAPGEYTVSLAVRQKGELTEVAGPRSFTVKSMPQGKETSQAPDDVLAFQRKAGELFRAVSGAGRLSGSLNQRIDHLKAAIPRTPSAGESQEQRLRAIEARLDEVNVLLLGDSSVSSRNEPTPWSVSRRAGAVYGLMLSVRSDVPEQYESSYAIAAEEFRAVLDELTSIESDLGALEVELERLGAPYTPGRVPQWRE